LTDFDGEWVPYVKIDAGTYRFYPISSISPSRIPKGQKHTFDIQMVRGTGVNANAYQLKMWVYNPDGSLLWSPSNYVSTGPGISGETMATGRWYTFNNAPNTRGFAVGCNGTLGTQPIMFGDQGEVAIVSSLDNPSLTAGMSIGTYGSVEGES
jgi:hypothetical protein